MPKDVSFEVIKNKSYSFVLFSGIKENLSICLLYEFFGMTFDIDKQLTGTTYLFRVLDGCNQWHVFLQRPDVSQCLAKSSYISLFLKSISRLKGVISSRVPKTTCLALFTYCYFVLSAMVSQGITIVEQFIQLYPLKQEMS